MTDPRSECACGNRLYDRAPRCGECLRREAMSGLSPLIAEMEGYARHLKKKYPADRQIAEALSMADDIREARLPAHRIAAGLRHAARLHRPAGSPYLAACMEMIAERMDRAAHLN